MNAVFYIIGHLCLCQLTFSYPFGDVTSELLLDILDHYFSQEEELNLEEILNRLENPISTTPPLENEQSVPTGTPFVATVPASGKVRIAATFNDIRPLNSFNFYPTTMPMPIVNYKNLVINENLLTSGSTYKDNVIPLSGNTIQYYNGIVPASGTAVIAGRFDDYTSLYRYGVTQMIPPIVISSLDYPGVITPALSSTVVIPEAYKNPTPVTGEVGFLSLVPAYGKVTIVANGSLN